MTDGLSLGELIKSLNLSPERIAIELNQNVVRRVDWATTKLSHNDRVEIVHFVGGGSSSRLPIGNWQSEISTLATGRYHPGF